MSVDPLAEKYPAWSPYNYVMNNPVNLIDPTGMGPTDHWITDSNGNAILIDTIGNEIYLDGILITNYNFENCSDYNALSQITTYYYNKVSNKSDIYLNQVSILNYTGYELTNTYNWDLTDKPFNNELAPRLFAYSKKQYDISDNRLGVPVVDGKIDIITYSSKYNLISSLEHENVHFKQALDFQPYSDYEILHELNAYFIQFKSSNFKETTGDFQIKMKSNIKDYMSTLKTYSRNIEYYENLYSKYEKAFNL